MQVEMSLQEKSLQTSPRDEYSKPDEQNILADDIVPNVAENLVQDIVCTMPISIATETQGTTTETVETQEGITQTTPRDEVLPEVASGSNVASEPYEIHIQASFIIPEDATTHSTTEIQKSYIIDETQPGLVREIETTSEEKDKKSKSKSKKKKKKSQTVDTIDPRQSAIVEQVPCVDNEKQEQKTFATLKITKTTVYETSNLLGKVRRPNDSAISIEEVASSGNFEVPFTQGNRKNSETNLIKR